MFGRGRWKAMEQQLRRLEQRVVDLERRWQERQGAMAMAVGAAARGWPLPWEAVSVVASTGDVEIVAAELDRWLAEVPNVLVLDVRDDAAWDRAHLAQAKHIPHDQVAARLAEMPDHTRPVLVISQNGQYSAQIVTLMRRAGFAWVFNVAGGMEGYTGPVVESEIRPLAVEQVHGTDRALIERVAQLLDRDVRPALVRDGGDLQLVAIENGIVSVRMVGACHGCGAQSRTVQQGIRMYLQHQFPELKGIEDRTGS